MQIEFSFTLALQKQSATNERMDVPFAARKPSSGMSRITTEDPGSQFTIKAALMKFLIFCPECELCVRHSTRFSPI